jgi:hypothetical protein
MMLSVSKMTASSSTSYLYTWLRMLINKIRSKRQFVLPPLVGSEGEQISDGWLRRLSCCQGPFSTRSSQSIDSLWNEVCWRPRQEWVFTGTCMMAGGRRTVSFWFVIKPSSIIMLALMWLDAIRLVTSSPPHDVSWFAPWQTADWRHSLESRSYGRRHASASATSSFDSRRQIWLRIIALNISEAFWLRYFKMLCLLSLVHWHQQRWGLTGRAPCVCGSVKSVVFGPYKSFIMSLVAPILDNCNAGRICSSGW